MIARLVPRALALACLALSCACAATRPVDPAPAARSSDSSAAVLVQDAARTVREMRAATRQNILDYALEDARAVIVLPGVYHAGFYYSVHGGSGVLVARRPDGGWGAPVFVGLGGAGFGIQIGLERQRLVLVVAEQEMLESILDNGLHFDALAKYDIIGVREETGRGSLTERRPVAAFSDGVGLMAGVGLRGAVLTANEGLTRDYHGRTDADVRSVMAGSSAPGMEVFELWGALAVSLPREQIQRTQP